MGLLFASNFLFFLSIYNLCTPGTLNALKSDFAIDNLVPEMLQAPEKFVAAATRNPACNLALMVGTTDIPDWCYVEAYGSEGKHSYTEAPSAEHLALFHSKSPLSYISKVGLFKLLLLY